MNSGVFNTIFDSDSDNEDHHRERKRKIFKNRINNMILWDDEEFIDRFRVSKEVVFYLTSIIEEEIKTQTEKNLAVNALDQILVALQFYSSGSFMRLVGDAAGLHKSTVCKIIHRVTEAIAKLRPQFIKMPSNEADKKLNAVGFYSIARFPKVLGTIDCTHVGVQSPGGTNAEDFRNRKGTFSVNVQVVADADLFIQNIVARWPGSSHDSHIFNSSNVKQRLESGEFGDYWLLGDSGYGLQPYLLTPLANPTSREERLYNESQIRTRNTVERLFGVWKRRFPVLSGKIRCRLSQYQPIIVATAVLHNLCRKFRVRQPVDNPLQTIEDTARDRVAATEANSIVGLNVRQQLINTYFRRYAILLQVLGSKISKILACQAYNAPRYVKLHRLHTINIMQYLM